MITVGRYSTNRPRRDLCRLPSQRILPRSRRMVVCATIFFSLPFSSSSGRSRRPSFNSNPPYLAFQWENVASLIPIRRQSSFTGTPASASFNTPTICSSEKRLFFMGASPLVVLYPEKLTYGWTSFRGAGQLGLKRSGIDLKSTLGCCHSRGREGMAHELGSNDFSGGTNLSRSRYRNLGPPQMQRLSTFNWPSYTL